MATTQYVGARYVPLFKGEWDKTQTYEPLCIVQYQGNSYTSVQYVPTGVDIANEEYWALTGNYNAQVEEYRKETTDVVNYTNLLSLKIVYPEQFTGTKTQQLQAAIVFAQNTGAVLVIADEYEIDNSLIISKPIIIIGEGTIIATGAFNAIQIIPPQSGLKNVIINNINFKGPNAQGYAAIYKSTGDLYNSDIRIDVVGFENAFNFENSTWNTNLQAYGNTLSGGIIIKDGFNNTITYVGIGKPSNEKTAISLACGCILYFDIEDRTGTPISLTADSYCVDIEKGHFERCTNTTQYSSLISATCDLTVKNMSVYNNTMGENVRYINAYTNSTTSIIIEQCRSIPGGSGDLLSITGPDLGIASIIGCNSFNKLYNEYPPTAATLKKTYVNYKAVQE